MAATNRAAPPLGAAQGSVAGALACRRLTTPRPSWGGHPAPPTRQSLCLVPRLPGHTVVDRTAPAAGLAVPDMPSARCICRRRRCVGQGTARPVAQRTMAGSPDMRTELTAFASSRRRSTSCLSGLAVPSREHLPGRGASQGGAGACSLRHGTTRAWLVQTMSIRRPPQAAQRQRSCTSGVSPHPAAMRPARSASRWCLQLQQVSSTRT
jgi:hypothetical protein